MAEKIPKFALLSGRYTVLTGIQPKTLPEGQGSTLTHICKLVNLYVQPYTFYLIVWLITLLLAVSGGFLLGFLLRDRQYSKGIPKVNQPSYPSGIAAERKRLLSSR